MEDYRNSITVLFVIIYMVLCIIIGLWAMKRTKNTEDFFMAGRKLGFFITAMAMFSSLMSGFGFVGGPGLIYRMGSSAFWMFMSVTMGFLIMGVLLGKRIRLFGEFTKSVSLPDLAAARYKNETTRLLMSIAIILGVIGYLGTQIMAMAIVLQSVINNVDWIPNISSTASILISSSVLVFYCVTGGIIASVYTDVVQGTIMLISAILIFFTALAAVDGGLSGIATTMFLDDPESIGSFGTLGMIGCLSWYFVFAVGVSGQPHLITKLMMTRNVSQNKQTVPLSMISYGISTLLIIGIGLVLRTLVLQGIHPSPAKADDVAALFLQSYAHPILAGVVIAGLFAAVMSTADAFLNIGVAAIVHDIPKAIGRTLFKNELYWSRIMTIILAAVAIIFAIYSSKEMVALLGAFGFSTFAAAIVPTIAIGLNWKRATATAANVAMAVSLTLIFFLQLGNINIPYGIDKGAIAILVSLVLFFSISFFSKPPKIDPYIDELMDL